MINFDIHPYVEEPDDIDFELDPLTEDKFRDKIDDVVDDAQDAWDEIRSDGDDADAGAAVGKLTNSARAVTDYINKDVLDPFTVKNPSVIQRASKSTMQFPIYISENILSSPSIAQILCNMIERTYATFVQQAFAMNKIITADQANDLKFMKTYHTNLREAAEFIDSDKYKKMLINEYYEPIDDFDQMMMESLANDIKLNERVTVSFRMVPYKEPTLCLESKRLASDACEGLKVLTEDKDDSVKKYRISKTIRQDDQHFIDDEEIRQIYVDSMDLKDPNERAYAAVEFPKGDINAQNRYLNQRWDDYIATNPQLDPNNPNNANTAMKRNIWMAAERRRWEQVSDRVNSGLNQAKQQVISGKGGPLKGQGLHWDPDRKQFYRTSARITNSTQDELVHKPVKQDNVKQFVAAPQILKDNEIRKINQMDPWMIQVTFRVKADDGSLDSIIPFLIGVKGVMHAVRARDLQDDLYGIVTGNNKGLQKIRYKTGEISFIDYMFNASQLKKDAMKNIDHNKRWVNNLKRLAELANLKGSSFKQIVELLNKGDVPIPNATLILTREDVQDLKDTSGVDINKLNVARTLLKNLFLISIIIVNIEDQTMKILYGNMSSDWQIQSMATIQADNARAMNSEVSREMEKIVNKMVNH